MEKNRRAAGNLAKIIRYLLLVADSKCRRHFNSPVSPRLLSYIATWRCSAKCVMCDVWKQCFDNNREKPELSADRIKNIFQDKMLRKIEFLKISGGEPMLKEDLPEIIKAIYCATNLNLAVVNTNGLDPDRVRGVVQEVSSFGVPLYLKVSLDAIGELHDKIRGVKGAFDKVYRTLEELKRLQEKHGFYVAINHTVMNLNKGCIEDIRKLANDFNFGYNLGFAAPYNENMDFSAPTDKIPSKIYSDEFTIEELANLHSKAGININRQWIRKNFLSNHFFSKILEAYISEGAVNRAFYDRKYPDPPCMALFNWVRFMPDGDVAACNFKPGAVGNLNSSTFSEIWLSKKTVEKRLEVKRCEGCWNPCNIIPSAVYSGNVISWVINNQRANHSKF